MLGVIFETFVFGKGQSMPSLGKGHGELFGATRSSVNALPSEFTTCFLLI